MFKDCIFGDICRKSFQTWFFGESCRKVISKTDFSTGFSEKSILNKRFARILRKVDFDRVVMAESAFELARVFGNYEFGGSAIRIGRITFGWAGRALSPYNWLMVFWNTGKCLRKKKKLMSQIVWGSLTPTLSNTCAMPHSSRPLHSRCTADAHAYAHVRTPLPPPRPTNKSFSCTQLTRNCGDTSDTSHHTACTIRFLFWGTCAKLPFPDSAHTVPIQCPYSAHYSAHW